MTRWFWLSFANDSGNLGVAVIPVNETAISFIEVMDATDRIDLLRERGQFEDVWFYTAVQIASFYGINPGGEVQGHEITGHIDEIPERLRYRLVQEPELREAGLLV